MFHSKPKFATDDTPGLLTVLDKPITKPTIVCPDMVKLGIKHCIMREDECVMRLKENPRCIRECTAVDHLRTLHKIQPANPKIKEKTKWEREYRPKVKVKCNCGEVFLTQDYKRTDCIPCIIKQKIKMCRDKKMLERHKSDLERAYKRIEANKTRKRIRKW